jgi:hypothetical protein
MSPSLQLNKMAVVPLRPLKHTRDNLRPWVIHFTDNWAPDTWLSTGYAKTEIVYEYACMFVYCLRTAPPISSTLGDLKAGKDL